MMKYNGIIVVEGNTDESILRTFLDCEIVKTGGSAVTRGTMEYLKECSKHREIIVLTDPDFPGMQIRSKLDAYIPNLKHAFVPKEKSIKGGKVGVAECSKDVIIDALEHVIENKISSTGTLTQTDLYDCGLIGQKDSSLKRQEIEKVFHTGHTNGKTLLRRLNSLSVTKKELLEALK